MKASLLTFLFLLPPLSLFAAQPVISLGAQKSLSHFESERLDRLPLSWRTWPFQRKKASQIYAVAEEKGNRFLRAVNTQGHAVHVLRNFEWPMKEYPLLTWRWRAQTLPKGADESKDQLNDSACSVYVIIGRLSGYAMKYVWSSTLPVGTVVSRKEGRLKVKVLNSGETKKGKWQEHGVNVLKDHRELFGHDLEGQSHGIALLTDGDGTHTPAACDYDDFAIGSPAAELKKAPAK